MARFSWIRSSSWNVGNALHGPDVDMLAGGWNFQPTVAVTVASLSPYHRKPDRDSHRIDPIERSRDFGERSFCYWRSALGDPISRLILPGFGCRRGSGRLGRFREVLAAFCTTIATM